MRSMGTLFATTGSSQLTLRRFGAGGSILNGESLSGYVDCESISVGAR